MKTRFEIYTGEEGPYGKVRGIRLTSAEPDNHRVFATFAQAKRELREILLAEEAELLERLALIRYNRMDLRRLRRKELRND